uniref:Uncharacterized protein n=1 Tax=Aegilops tauschii TaxID=37682 RepID=M8BBW8_AEGTA
MGDVRIVSRRMVRPDPSIRWPPEHQPETIHPTPWDLRMLAVDYIQKGVLLPKTPAATTQGQGRNIPVVDRLSSSFASALGRFYHLAGRLAVNDDGAGAGQTISLRCSNEGAEFVHAVAPGVTVADITAPLCIPRVVWSFFPLNGVLVAEAATGSRPVLAAQGTHLGERVFVAFLGIAKFGVAFIKLTLLGTWGELDRDNHGVKHEEKCCGAGGSSSGGGGYDGGNSLRSGSVARGGIDDYSSSAYSSGDEDEFMEPAVSWSSGFGQISFNVR